LSVSQLRSCSYREADPLVRGATMVRFCSCQLISPVKRLLPDLLTESMVNPPERSKSTARAPPRTVVTCAMSCEAGSADNVPNSGSVTLTPSNW
jgi:hypothetical protein